MGVLQISVSTTVVTAKCSLIWLISKKSSNGKLAYILIDFNDETFQWATITELVIHG